MSYVVASPNRLTFLRPPWRSRPSARVVFRRRLVTVMLVGLLLFAVVAMAGWLGREDSTSGVAGSQPVATRHHVVESGDTLWAIARKYHPNDDVRPYVQRWMAERNGRPLQPGERIAIP